MTIPLNGEQLKLENAGSKGASEFLYLAVFITLGNLTSHLYFVSFSIINMFLYAFVLALLLLVLAKLTEPKYVLKLTPTDLVFYHRYGQLVLPWRDISRIGEVMSDQVYGQHSLGFIGIKLKHPDDVYQNIPLRLAGRLFTEQKSIIHRLSRYHHYSTNKVLDLFNPKLDYKTANGEIFTGVIAMFINRCDVLNKELGFHLYLPSESFIISPDEVVKILNFRLKNNIKASSK